MHSSTAIFMARGLELEEGSRRAASGAPGRAAGRGPGLVGEMARVCDGPLVAAGALVLGVWALI
uniref:Uncharacterized protein n=1 Tax=Arundo donax TaxID=35708 RepID=A0A0A9FLC4_ARUDO